MEAGKVATWAHWLFKRELNHYRIEQALEMYKKAGDFRYVFGPVYEARLSAAGGLGIECNPKIAQVLLMVAVG